MQKLQHKFAVLIALGWLLTCAYQAQACSLALHDWKRLFHLRLPLSAPLTPLAELDAILDKFPRNSLKQILWVANHNLFSSFSIALLPLLPNWEAHLPWQTLPTTASVVELAKGRQDQSDIPLIIGADQNQLQIALFVDSNSSNRCFQLVLMQTSRIRSVYASRQTPWAQESRGMTWVSLVFYQLPLPGRILSLAVFPVYQTRRALIDNHEYVEQLLAEKFLATRPEQIFDPYTFDFPDLPE